MAINCRCIFCRADFDASTNRPEHIVPCALGGRVESSKIVCSACNGRLGSEIDARLAILLEHLRFGLVVRNCYGELPPAVSIAARSSGIAELCVSAVTSRPGSRKR